MNRTCEVCGGGDEKGSFQVIIRNETHTFDTFDCASQALAPRCVKCDRRIGNRVVNRGGEVYCSWHFPRRAEDEELAWGDSDD